MEGGSYVEEFHERTRLWLAFLTLGVIWGAPFLLVKIAVRYVASVDEERHPVGSGPRFMRLSHA